MSDADSEGDEPTRTERVRVGLRRLERITLGAERPLNKALGTPLLNPLAHTGTLAVLFFIIVLVSGVYLTALFDYGFVESYEAVARLEDNLMGRFMRAIHRYGSVALVITSLLHGWRTFVQDRFRGPRWIAWVSGIWMVAMLWFIGVTGYWMLWDERAQALNEILIRAFRGTEGGLDFLLDNLLTPAAGTGWPFLLWLLLIHLGLSIVMGGVLIVHLVRLTPKQWFPPMTWTSIAGGVLVLLSILWPVGLLPPLDGARIPSSFPVDPFYLFLFPLGLNLSPWLVWGGLLVIGLILTVFPWIKQKSAPRPVIIDEDRCTGCTLCVVDCPYGALEMVPREDGKHRQLAVLVEDRCVSCGVCVGSCSDDALSLPEESIDSISEAVTALASSGDNKRIVISCERHVSSAATDDPDVHVVAVNCAGVVHPHLAERALDAGADDVQIVGCAPADCANRFGNTYAQARIDRIRVPRLKRRYEDSPIESDWVPSVSMTAALADPDGQPVADPNHKPSRSGMVRLGLVVLLFAALTIVLTNIPFSPGFASGAVVSIAMDHQGGAVLVGLPGEPELEDGGPTRLVVTIDNGVVLDKTYATVVKDGIEVSQALERIEMPPGLQAVRIEMFDRVDPTYSTVLFDDAVVVPAGDVLEFAFIDRVFESRAEAGRSLYFETTLGVNAGCRVCHSLRPGEVIVGPTFAGIGTAAATRIPGMSAEDYLFESILDPNAYIVDGFEPNVMLANYDELLSEEEIANLVAFLLTLE
ncbi:MAG: hydrogenase iron-sulfur subunit [Acidimicrobiia bacterium]